MASVELLVTDVTRYGPLYCVAGWDRQQNCMIRPEPPDVNPNFESTRFWDAAWAGPKQTFSLGTIVRFDAKSVGSGFEYPHATEDRIVTDKKTIEVIGRLNAQQLSDQTSCSRSENLMLAFDDGLIRSSNGKAYVTRGHIGRSLGAIIVRAKELVFHEDTWNPNRPKLRANVTSGGVVYDLSVTCDATLTRWKSGGTSILQADLKNAETIDLRVGLARA